MKKIIKEDRFCEICLTKLTNRQKRTCSRSCSARLPKSQKWKAVRAASIKKAFDNLKNIEE